MAKDKKKLSDETKLQLRQAIRKIKQIDDEIKKPFKGSDLPKHKELDQLRAFVKNTSLEFGIDFDFPEGKTEMRTQTREGYDKGMLDEMIENGTFDADTAALILSARKSDTVAVFIVK